MDITYKKRIELIDFASKLGIEKKIVDISSIEKTFVIKCYSDDIKEYTYDNEEFESLLKKHFIGNNKEIVSFHYIISFPPLNGYVEIGYRNKR